MLKVMLVDDKQSIVDGLACYIDWKQFGFEIVAKTTDAFYAIEMAREKQIDLIITDIRMPDMSGFEMIAEISKMLPVCKYIILSGYSEFEYAKKAIEQKASGYLLKPIDSEELTNLLVRVKSEIEKEKEVIKKKTEEYIKSILNGENTGDIKRTDFRTDSNFRYIIISKNEITDKELSIINHMKYNDDLWVIERTSDVIAMVINSLKYPKSVAQLTHVLKTELGLSDATDYIVFIGKEISGINNIMASKRSIKNLEYARFYEPTRNVFIYEDYENKGYTEEVHDISVAKMFEAVTVLDRQKFVNYVDEFKKEVEKRRLYPELVIGFFNKFIYDVADYVDKSNGNSALIINQWSSFKNTTDLSFKKFCNLVIEIWDLLYIELQIDDKYDREKIIEDIIEYLNRNYSNVNLSLQDVSKEYFITSAYLGKLFKQKTGESFRTYLLKLRFEKAKALLENSDHPVYKIARKVGFADGTYFISKFKESEGITPDKYRLSVRNKES